MAFGHILWSFGIFSPFWYIVPRKIWQPWPWHGGAIHFFPDFKVCLFVSRIAETHPSKLIHECDSGRPDEFVKKIAQNVAQHITCRN
jgi:hypothetical protein